MKKVFQINEAAAAQMIQPVLNIRVGENHLSVATTDQVTAGLSRLLYYLDPEGISFQPLKTVVEEEMGTADSYYQVKICYDFPGNALVPAAGFRQDEASLFQTVPVPATVVITEAIPEWQLYNVYSVPSEIHQFFQSRFPNARYRNQFTVGLRQLDAAREGGSLLVDIRHSDFSVLAAHAGKLLLAQTYAYTIPEDIIYYLLKICQQFKLSQQEVLTSVSGLIDQDSALYKELYQYFIHIRFRNNPWKGLGREYPSHFFTSLNDIEQCVS